MERYSSEAVRMLLEKENVNVLGQSNTSALHIAVKRGGIEVVRLLLKENANTNVVNDHGYSPLDYVANYTQLAEILMQVGAKRSKRIDDHYDWSACMKPSKEMTLQQSMHS